MTFNSKSASLARVTVSQYVKPDRDVFPDPFEQGEAAFPQQSLEMARAVSRK